MEAARNIHPWHTRQMAVALQELRHRAMRPASARNYNGVARRIDGWSEANVELARVGAGYQELLGECNIAAFGCIAVGNIKEHIDLKIPEPGHEVWRPVRLNEVMAYAGVRMAEAKARRSGDDIDAWNAWGCGSHGARHAGDAPLQMWQPPCPAVVSTMVPLGAWGQEGRLGGMTRRQCAGGGRHGGHPSNRR